MQHLNQQRGMATLLLVLLVGVSIMLITAGFARSLSSKKEATVAAHAQTNAQLMGWTGVSAFREYIMAQGRNNPAGVIALHGQTITLRNDANQKEILAKNIQVQGCNTGNPICRVTADISSDHKTAQAATTIQVVYNLDIADTGTIPEKVVLSFTGNTTMSSTTIRAEVPNSDVVINADGNMSLLAGLRLENVRELEINAKGDVIINCGTMKCGSTIINVNATGRVDLSDGGNYGIVRANTVSISTSLPKETRVREVYSRGNVNITGNSFVQQVNAVGNVEITAGGFAGDILANGWVKLTTSKANHIQSQKYAYLSDSTVENDVRVYESVELLAGAHVKGSIYAQGKRTLTTVSIPVREAAVTHSTSRVDGTIYAKPLVYFYGAGRASNVVSPKVRGAQSVATNITETNDITQVNFTIPSVNRETIRQEIAAKMDFRTKVDVTVYKNDANYIFTHNGGMSRVFLNHLYNTATDKTYMYENGAQYEVDREGNKTLINETGFFIGDYQYQGREWIGAICLSVESGKCNAQGTDIIGFLPRLTVGKTWGVTNDYDFTHTSPRKTWILRTTSAVSTIDNPAFAPGILYFEGDVALMGHGNVNADSMTSAFTNTILAEGEIRAEAVSPRIYSPYNLIREGDDKVAIICDRTLKDIYGSPINAVTTPATYSNKYLVPVNLCKNASEFQYNMNRAADGTKLKVEIDGVMVDKLDLGYVALMSNHKLSIGTCARIYGDIYTRSSVAGSGACGATSNPHQIVGSIASQGEAPYISGAPEYNTFTNSTLVVPDPKFTGAKNTEITVPSPGVTAVNLQWSKYR